MTHRKQSDIPANLNIIPEWWRVFEPRKGVKSVEAFDGWCGLGNGTMSIIEGCLKRGWYIRRMTAVNHWPAAILVHARNYPQVCQFCAKMENIDPRVLVPSGHLDILTAGIKCQPFSQAAGGKERNEQERLDIFQVLRMAMDVDISTIVLENVLDFKKFGPLSQDGRPIKRLEGTLYEDALQTLRHLNYKVDVRELMACWFGDPTRRTRLWIVAKKGTGRKMFFPAPTHRDPNQPPDMFNATQPTWPVARDIINFNLPTKSIFGGKHVPNTLSRILAGADRYAGLRLEFPALPGCPPLPGRKKKKGARVSPYAQSAWNLHYLNCALRVANGLTLEKKNTKLIGRVDPEAIELVRTVQRLAINGKPEAHTDEAFMIKLYGTAVTASLDAALPTATTSNHLGIVMVNKGGGDGYERNTPVNEAMPCLTTSPAASLVSFVISGEHVNGDDRVYPIDKEVPTLTGTPDWAIAAVFLTQYHNHEDRDRVQPINQALPTVDTSNRYGLAYIVAFYGTASDGQSVNEALRTVTTKDRFLLVIPGRGLLDIRTRMLVLDELRKAQSIPDGFDFSGVSVEDGKKMVGNSWALKQSIAVIDAALV